MNTKTKHGCRRLLAMLLVVISVMGLIAVPAFAGQEDGYHDPAERWMNASNRTNELDVNATVTHETFHCYQSQVLESAHPRLIITLKSLALYYEKVGDVANTIKTYERIYDLQCQRYGITSARTNETMSILNSYKKINHGFN